jgi:hypothetical protein
VPVDRRAVDIRIATILTMGRKSSRAASRRMAQWGHCAGVMIDPWRRRQINTESAVIGRRPPSAIALAMRAAPLAAGVTARRELQSRLSYR